MGLEDLLAIGVARGESSWCWSVPRRRRAVAVARAGPACRARAEPPPLIPRDVLFGNPDKASPQISPDGKRLAYLAPDEQERAAGLGADRRQDDDKAVTADKKRGIRQLPLDLRPETLLYLQDKDGDENFHVYAVDLDDREGPRPDAVPGRARATLVDLDPKHPDEVLVGMNKRDRKAFDVYRLNLDTGALTLDTENPGDVVGWVTDAALPVRAAQVATPDGGTELRVRDDAKAPLEDAAQGRARGETSASPASPRTARRSTSVLHRRRHRAAGEARPRHRHGEGARRGRARRRWASCSIHPDTSRRAGGAFNRRPQTSGRCSTRR